MPGRHAMDDVAEVDRDPDFACGCGRDPREVRKHEARRSVGRDVEQPQADIEARRVGADRQLRRDGPRESASPRRSGPSRTGRCRFGRASLLRRLATRRSPPCVDGRRPGGGRNLGGRASGAQGLSEFNERGTAAGLPVHGDLHRFRGRGERPARDRDRRAAGHAVSRLPTIRSSGRMAPPWSVTIRLSLPGGADAPTVPAASRTAPGAARLGPVLRASRSTSRH